MEFKYFQNFELSRIVIELINDQVTYQNEVASDVFVDSLPVVRVKAFGLSPGKSLTLELSDFKEIFSLYNRVSLFSLVLSILHLFFSIRFVAYGAGAHLSMWHDRDFFFACHMASHALGRSWRRLMIWRCVQVWGCAYKGIA